MSEEYKKHTPIAPFAYDTDYYLYTDKEVAEKEQFVSLMTQRDAVYKDAAEETFIPEKLGDYPAFWAVFRDNLEAPTPRILEIDGYDGEETEGGGESGEDDGQSGDDDGC